MMKRLITVAAVLMCAVSVEAGLLDVAWAKRKATAPTGYWKYTPWTQDIMTGSNAPSPNLLWASSEFSSTFYGWKTMDNDNTRWYCTNPPAYPEWLTIDYGAATSHPVRSVLLRSAGNVFKHFELAGSDDGSSWTVAITGQMVNISDPQVFQVPSIGSKRFWKLSAIAPWGTVVWLEDWMMYAAAERSQPMTAANAPSPCVVSASTESSTAWQGWDGTPNANWWTTVSTGLWFKVDCGSNVTYNGYYITVYVRAPKTIDLYGSTDDSSWDLISARVELPSGTHREGAWFTNDTPYRYYRFNVTSTWDANGIIWQDGGLLRYEHN